VNRKIMFFSRSSWYFGYALLALSLALAGCSATPSSQAAPPASLEIGAVVPLTGRYAAGGEQVRDGYQLAVDDINATGGVAVGGVQIPLHLNVLDDESDPVKTVQQMETLYTQHDVLAYLGGFGSDLHAAAAGIAEKNQVPYLGIAFSLQKIHQQGFKYLFSPFPKSPDMAIATFDLLDSLSPKPSRIAIFAEKTDWGAELQGLWQAQASQRSYSVVTDQEYTPGTQDYSAMILAAKDAAAEVVLALPNPPDALALAKQMKELDYNAKMYVFIRGADSLAWPQNLGADGDYFLMMNGWNPAVHFPGAAEMAQRFQEKFGQPAQATSGPAYAAVQVLADAIQRAGSLDRAAIRDALAATDLMTVIGPVKFNPDGTARVTNVINQWQNGQQVVVWPPEQASAPVIFPALAWNDPQRAHK
jgi:branched-chain amino acid transport system substrate-binding protein